MVRQALFNILQEYIAERPFLDVFAGTGVVGFEALSRGAQPVEFIERDIRTAPHDQRRAGNHSMLDCIIESLLYLTPSQRPSSKNCR